MPEDRCGVTRKQFGADFLRSGSIACTAVNANTDGYTFAQLTKDVRGKKCFMQRIKDIFAKKKYL